VVVVDLPGVLGVRVDLLGVVLIENLAVVAVDLAVVVRAVVVVVRAVAVVR
jgi:hypothetical protein